MTLRRISIHLATTIAALLIAAPQAAALNAVATVDRTRIGRSESVMLSISTSAEDPEVDTAAIKDFKALSKGRQSSISIVNNQMSRQTVLQYALIPLKEGTLQIPPLTVADGGNVVRTRPITVIVSARRANADAGDEMMVSAVVSKPRPFAGQQLVYTFQLRTRVRFANARFQAPDFDGFSATQVDGQHQYQQVVDGKRYQVTELRTILVPLKSGAIHIAAAELTCDVPTRGRGQAPSPLDSMFGGPFFGSNRLASRVLRTQELTLDVRPLPPYQEKASFSGLIGKFSLEATIDKSALAAGDSATLAVTLVGSGNLQDAGSPTIPFPAGFKAYEDAPEATIRADENGFSGKKVFRTALVPTVPGSYVIPAVTVVVFDTGTGAYRKLQTDPILVSVMAVHEKNASIVVSAAPDASTLPKKQTVTMVGKDILPLKTDPSILKTVSPLSPITFLVLGLLPPMAYLMILAGLYFLRKNGSARQNMAEDARHALKEAKARLSVGADTAPSLTMLKRAVTCAVFAAGGREGAALTYDEASALMLETGLPEPFADSVSDLMRGIDTAVYGGVSPDAAAARAFITQAEPMIRRLTK